METQLVLCPGRQSNQKSLRKDEVSFFRNYFHRERIQGHIKKKDKGNSIRFEQPSYTCQEFTSTLPLLSERTQILSHPHSPLYLSTFVQTSLDPLSLWALRNQINLLSKPKCALIPMNINSTPFWIVPHYVPICTSII